MKNMIITVGLLLLMMMGLLYDQDSMEVTRIERRLRWICEEMAAGATICREQGGSLRDAENAAEKILQRNLHLDKTMKPKVETGILQETVKWKMVFDKEKVRAEVNCGMGRIRLRSLEDYVELRAKGTYDRSRIFYGEGGETS